MWRSSPIASVSESAHSFEPLVVRTVPAKVIRMALYGEASGYKYFGKSLTEIAIREKNAIQAARS